MKCIFPSVSPQFALIIVVVFSVSITMFVWDVVRLGRKRCFTASHCHFEETFKNWNKSFARAVASDEHGIFRKSYKHVKLDIKRNSVWHKVLLSTFSGQSTALSGINLSIAR